MGDQSAPRPGSPVPGDTVPADPAPSAGSPATKRSRNTASETISAKRLTKTYGDFTAVQGLTLSVHRGEIFGLLGPNGAGKTTTILMLLGLTEPTSGTVRVLGLDPTREALAVKGRVGYLPDAVGFYPTLTGRENLRYTTRLNGLARAAAEQRIAEVLDLVELSDRADDRAGTYSRGMTQRLGIADALIKQPDVLILDEPTVGLDPRAADQILDTIHRLATDRGVTVLLSSHLLGQVQAICHRVGIFVGGSLKACGTIDELAAEHGGRMLIEVAVRGGDATEVLRRITGVVDITPADGGGYLLGVQRDISAEIGTALARADFVVTRLQLRSEELGRLYRRYFSEEHHDAA